MAGKLTLAVRVALGFGALLLVLVVAIAVGLSRSAAINEMIEQVVTRDWQNTVHANRIIGLVDAQAHDTFRLFYAEERTPIVVQVTERVATISALLDEFDAQLDDSRSHALMEQIRTQRAAYVASLSLVLELLERGQSGAASRLMEAETVPALHALTGAIGELISLHGQILADTGTASLTAFATARQLQAGLLGMALVLALLLSTWIVRAVLRPLGGEPDEVKAVVERIARGDLDTEIRVRGDDEHSLLASVRHMRDKLREQMHARDEAEARRLHDAARLRDALVREVHHRIKNNLQTVVGLLRRIGGCHPGSQAMIDAAVAQVQAVAVVHGMYGRVTDHSIPLRQLLPEVVRSVSELTGMAIACHGAEDGGRASSLSENETVAVALILNELITNAVKHTSAQLGVERPQVVLKWAEGRACVTVVNCGSLPVGFDFDHGRGVGTGLGLVRALMPVRGMWITFRQRDIQVEVTVAIGVPVLCNTSCEDADVEDAAHS
jgi:two-component sensor histidine kinase